MTLKVAESGGEDTEKTILHVAPEQEALDWICYRVRGGLDPTSEQAAAARSAAEVGPRPERDDIEKALRRLVSLGMLTYDGRRWSMTPKGYAAT